MTNEVCPEAVHEALKTDEAWWAAQPRTRIPYVTYELDEGDVTFECRNCSKCRSTLYRKLASVGVVDSRGLADAMGEREPAPSTP